ncbi:hypothetical protein FNV43_RR18864 [Rhamnella rubrinervis]|uniref:Uncharacterized protein n=1 Tax=Rhamnella rubrinervis TaxID=2594499 RepID=A0A8K0E739_9ROSA|nr:hypothetical protein FNV43_RR18864 [Rhamnella rubrinervis]
MPRKFAGSIRYNKRTPGQLADAALFAGYPVYNKRAPRQFGRCEFGEYPYIIGGHPDHLVMPQKLGRGFTKNYSGCGDIASSHDHIQLQVALKVIYNFYEGIDQFEASILVISAMKAV